MNGLYIISLVIAFLSVLPVVILVIRTECQRKRTLHIICADCFTDIMELEQRIREVWWETHFNGDAAADDIVVLIGRETCANGLCKRLKREFPKLIVSNEKKFIKYLRNEYNGRKKVYRA